MQTLAKNINNLNRQTVIVRCNFDVPLESGRVGDTTRIEDAIPTLKLLLTHRNRLILLAHAGRPKGVFQAKTSLKPIIPILESNLKQGVNFVTYQKDPHSLSFQSDYPIQLVDNLRFWPQEETNDRPFAQIFATQATVYINEAFANCHRQHASIVALPKLLPDQSFAGLSLTHEIQMLNKVSVNPPKPFIVVIGGAKLETKEPLVMSLAPKADALLVGGKIAADLMSNKELPPNVHLAQLVPSGKDITPESAEQFAQKIMSAQSVIWNGTMGVFEDKHFQQGTQIIAHAVNDTPAFTVVGGGDTETALTLLDLESGIDYISTGGGAMLTYLSTGNLVGLQALETVSL